MTINPFSNVNQTLFSGITSNLTPGAGSTTVTGSTTNDNSQISPFAQLMNYLQQLQQQNPTQFKQITGQLATDLQTAATNAQNHGNCNEANALNQLASVFQQSSTTGQLPDFQQQAAQNASTSGHHHHHHHGGGSGNSQIQSLGQDLDSISQSILASLDPSPTGTSTQQ